MFPPPTYQEVDDLEIFLKKYSLSPPMWMVVKLSSLLDLRALAYRLDAFFGGGDS
jgi:hypothetical protein